MLKPVNGMAVIGLVAMAALAPSCATAGLGEAGELEHARANARAGGPTNARDAELLNRYGCLSGTDSAFCERQSRRHHHHRHHRRHQPD